MSLLHFTLASDSCNFIFIVYKYTVGANCPALCTSYLQNHLRDFDETGAVSLDQFVCVCVCVCVDNARVIYTKCLTSIKMNMCSAHLKGMRAKSNVR
jgi:hypothetical protein